MLKRTILLAAVTALTATFAGAKAAEQVFLDSANTVDTYHQDNSARFSAQNAVNGRDPGWAIEGFPPGPDGTVDQSAVFPLLQPISLLAGSSSITLTVFLEHLSGEVNFHNLGHFALSFTENVNPNLGSTFDPVTIQSIHGTDAATTFSVAGNLVVVGGANPAKDVYTAQISITPSGSQITGFVLDVFDSNGSSLDFADGLPTGGPGRAGNGNFVLSRFIIVTVPSSTDHLSCYDIGSTPGGPKILEVGIDVTLLNRFQDAIIAVGKPVRLCTPVDKNGEGVSNPNALWVCYRIEEPVVSVNEDVVVTNQFDPLNVDQAMRVKKIKTVCVPSELATP